MADQDVTIPEMDDAELFRSAVAEAPVEKEQAQEERPRDDQGRFVSAEKEPQPEAKAQPEKVEQPAQQEQAAPEQPKTEQSDDGAVPSWRLRELREARDAATRKAEEAQRLHFQTQAELQAMREQMQKLQQPKQEPIDFFADPDKALQQHLTPVQQQMQTFMQDMTLRMSRTSAIAQHGAPAVVEMETAIKAAMEKHHPDMPMLALQMRQSDDPAGVAMSWYQRTKLWDATGGDPEAYKSKVLEEALKNPEFLSKAIEAARGQAGQTKGAPVVQLPPSLNRTPSAGASHTADDGDMSDAGLFKHAMAGKGRR